MTEKSFWGTEYTLPEGAGFRHFCVGHLLWLGLAAVLCAAVWLAFRRRKMLPARLMRVFAALLVLDELFKYYIALRSGVFAPSFLPLHLCSINIFLITADALRPNPYLRELLYAECLPGAAMALVFPGWAYLPIKNALCIHSFSAHILLLLYPVLLLAEGFRPNFHRLARTFPMVLAAAALAYGFNAVFGTNFMFLRYAGTGNPLAWLESLVGTPGYLIGIPVIAALCWAVMYGVPCLVQKRDNMYTR